MKSRVLLCSLDGVRPDALRRANAPVVQRLAREGACTWSARTVMPSVTLPCHTSMLRGVEPARHGITSNTFTPLARPVPSLIDLASEQGLCTGFFYSWEELRDLASPGKLDVSVMCSGYSGRADWLESDRLVAQQTVEHIPRANFELRFVYFGGPDQTGHDHGWMSQPYMDAIANADMCLGQVLDAVAKAGRADETTTLVLADHGGHERGHGTNCDEDMTIPWVLHGKRVKSGYEIPEPVRIFDTCTTLAHILGLKPSPIWEGRVVCEALIQ